jgi:acyl carrier protein
LVEALTVLHAAERADRLEEWLAGECAAVLGHPPDADLDRRRGFFDLGMDSLAAVRLAGRLGEALGVRVTPAVMFEYPNIAALTERLLRDLNLPVVAPEPAREQGAEDLAFSGSDEDALRLITDRYLELA